MVLQYSCPGCGSDMVFNAETGTLTCPSCGRAEKIEGSQRDFTPFEESFHSSTFGDEPVRQYQCQNCGAILITDENTTATRCSFCDSPVILGDRLSGALAPSKVIPFSITKDQAQEAFRKWLKRSRLSPDEFRNATRVKSVVGIYVPFWLYDVRGQGEAMAQCTKVRHYTSGDYDVTETKHYDVYRKMDLAFSRIPADASKKMADDLMDRLEPFDYTNLKDFNTPYLSGFLSEKYDYTDKEMFPRIKSRVHAYMDDFVKSTTLQYTTTTIHQRDYHIGQSNVEYTLCPVWMVYCDYDNAEYTFAMNGQSGKIAGAPPLSKPKAAGLFAAVTLGLFVLLRIITMLLGGPVL